MTVCCLHAFFSRLLRERTALSFFVLIGLFFSPKPAWADSLTLKNGKQLKGLVVERHADRIFFSTVKGEIPILLSGIKKIEYDDPAQNYLSQGKEFEAKNRLGEALAYYEKAVEQNPALDEARQRAQSVRNRFWTQSSTKPMDEISKRQALYDLWEAGGAGVVTEEVVKKGKALQAAQLKDHLGMSLEKKGDWVTASGITQKKDAWLSGIRRKDRLVSIDGNSLRYLSVEAVARMLLEPPRTACQLDYERDILLSAPADVGKMGLHLKLGERGLEIDRVNENSAGAEAGLGEQDLLTAINGQPTRYLSMGKVKQLIKNSPREALVFTVRRSAILTRR